MDITYSIYAVAVVVNQSNAQTAYTVRTAGALDVGTELETGFETWEKAWKRIDEICQELQHARESEEERREQQMEDMLSEIPGL